MGKSKNRSATKSRLFLDSSRRLYQRPFPARRSGALYAAFPYPTKISPEAIALFIAAHTEPGESVFDGFAGSGTTGHAVLALNKQDGGNRKFILVEIEPKIARDVTAERVRRVA